MSDTLLAPPRKQKKQDKPAIPTIQWSGDNYSLTWRLIGLVEEPENRKVLVGKSKDEVSRLSVVRTSGTDLIQNSSGENRARIYKRIAEKLFPAYFVLDAGTTANCIKSKWEAYVIEPLRTCQQCLISS